MCILRDGNGEFRGIWAGRNGERYCVVPSAYAPLLWAVRMSYLLHQRSDERERDGQLLKGERERRVKDFSAKRYSRYQRLVGRQIAGLKRRFWLNRSDLPQKLHRRAATRLEHGLSRSLGFEIELL
jgi:hypothetical protein